MKLQVLQVELNKALGLASRFVNPRAQLPILSNIVLNAEKTKLSLLSTNLEVSLATSIGAKVESEGSIAIPSKVITEIVANLAPRQIELSTEKEHLNINSENFSGRIMGINAADFPSVPQSLGKKVIGLPIKKFASALGQVVFSAAIDETRPVLTGVLFIFDDLNLILVATDGFRLSQKKIKLEKPAEKGNVILPKSFVGELTRILDKNDSTVGAEIKTTESQVVFGLPNTFFSTRIIDGEFPDFERIIPKTKKVTLKINKEDLLRSVKVASVFARESSNIIKFKVEKDAVSLLAESSRSGSQKSVIDAKVEGESLEIAYNFRFIEEFLSVVTSDEVEIELTDTSSPGVFKDPKDPDFLHLIMPVRM